MKKNVKDYDIFDDVPPFDILKYGLKTIEEYSIIQKTHGYNAIHFNPYVVVRIGNSGGEYPVLYDQKNKKIVDMKGNVVNEKIVQDTSMKEPGYRPSMTLYQQGGWPTVYEGKYLKPIHETKNAYKKLQEAKQGEFSYLWKENSTQTQIDVQEQVIQVIAEVNEQATQTKNKMVDVAVQTDPKEKELGQMNEKEIKLTKFVTQFYNKFADNEDVEEFYNEFLSIIDEHQELNILGDNSNNEF